MVRLETDAAALPILSSLPYLLAGPRALHLIPVLSTVLCLLAAGMMRRPWGVTLGWVVQALTLISAVVVPAMLLVGLLFLALWVLCMVQGARVDILQAQRAAEARGDSAAPPSIG